MARADELLRTSGLRSVWDIADEPLAALGARIGMADRAQIAIWREMDGAQRVEVAFQMFRLAHDLVLTDERRRTPDAPEIEIIQRVLQRLHGIDWKPDGPGTG